MASDDETTLASRFLSLLYHAIVFATAGFLAFLYYVCKTKLPQKSQDSTSKGKLSENNKGGGLDPSDLARLTALRKKAQEEEEEEEESDDGIKIQKSRTLKFKGAEGGQDEERLMCRKVVSGAVEKHRQLHKQDSGSFEFVEAIKEIKDATKRLDDPSLFYMEQGEEENNWEAVLEATVFLIGLEAGKLKSCRESFNIFSEPIEICVRENEGKLLKHYARILYYKWLHGAFNGESEECSTDADNLRSWFSVVNLSDAAVSGILRHVKNLFELVSLDDAGLDLIAVSCCISSEDKSRFIKSTKNIRCYFQRWKDVREDPKATIPDIDLSWGSYDRLCSRRSERRSESEKASASDSGVGSNPSLPSLPTQTPPPSPGYTFLDATSAATHNVTHPSHRFHTGNRSSPSPLEGFGLSSKLPATPSGLLPTTVGGKPKAGTTDPKTPSTPPPKWKFNIIGGPSSTQSSGITRSHSHESQLPYRVQQQGSSDLNRKAKRIGGTRLAPVKPTTLPITSTSTPTTNTDSLFSPAGSDITSDTSPVMSPPHNPYAHAVTSPPGEGRSYSQPPKSPKLDFNVSAKVRMNHNINHKLVKAHHYRFNELCKRCGEPIKLLETVLKCKTCKQRFHDHCGAEEDPICGLPEEYMKVMCQVMTGSAGSSSLSRVVSSSSSSGLHSYDRLSEYDAAERSGVTRLYESSSSTESSAPSTPAMRNPAVAYSPAQYPYQMKTKTTFTFPEVVTTPEVPNITIENTDQSFVNEITESLSSDDRTIGPHSIGSEDVTEHEESIHGGSGDLNDSNDGAFARKRIDWSGTSMKTNPWWIVDYAKIELSQPGSLIGRGHFGEVHKGYHYQPIALKFLDMDHVESDKQLEAFKQDVIATFRNTRHNNIILFLGCVLEPRLGILMDLCKGHTIYELLHVRKERDKFDLNRIISIAAGIVQGMSYLHGKKIVHKDLRTKNIFLENNRVVITDFALMSIRRLFKPSKNSSQTVRSFPVPEHWLCYLSPEVIRNIPSELDPTSVTELPFSTHSDVYAFGTVWYELLAGEFPFKRAIAESIIWQVGKGIKAPLSNVQMSKEVKDLLIDCWSFLPEQRPDFNSLTRKFEQLPKKRLARSPSHPVQHMSRSAESVF